MSIDVTWLDDDQTVIYMKYDGNWTWDENIQVNKDLAEILAPKTFIVPIILDVTNSHLLPKNALSAIRKSVAIELPNEGVKYVIGASMFVKRMFQLVKQVSRSTFEEYVFVNSIDEALSLIYNQKG